jgi:hypothetical protein
VPDITGYSKPLTGSEPKYSLPVRFNESPGSQPPEQHVFWRLIRPQGARFSSRRLSSVVCASRLVPRRLRTRNINGSHPMVLPDQGIAIGWRASLSPAFSLAEIYDTR